jgi:hypothetical protein
MDKHSWCKKVCDLYETCCIVICPHVHDNPCCYVCHYNNDPYKCGFKCKSIREKDNYFKFLMLYKH